MSFWAQVIASNLCTAALIGGLAWLVGRNGRRAKLAHSLWLLVFIKLVTPPLVTVPLPIPETWWFAEGSPVFDSPDPSGALVMKGEEDPSSRPTPQGDARRPLAADPSHLQALFSFSWGQCLFCVWMIGALWVTLRGTVKLVRFYRLIQRHGVLDSESTQFVGQLLRSAGDSTSARYQPKVLRVPMRVSPMLFGLGSRAFIVCPESLWILFGEEERQAFLAHESAHYYRRDHWTRWLEWSVGALYWWFPLVYFARQQLERHEEACCDAWAVRMLDTSPRQYAEALLQVVDFISEYEVGLVRLASSMHPTYTLEERLHWIMKGGPAVDQHLVARVGIGMMCLAVFALHPVLQPYRSIPVILGNQRPSQPRIDSSDLPADIFAHDMPTFDLPPEPEGFWSSRPQQRWANVSLTLPGARLVADAGESIRFVTQDGKTLRFRPSELSAVVEVPATRRVIIGDEDGQIRLWDLVAGMPVSLIGSHPAAITSLAYHEAAGVVSSDHAGSVMRWDIQSGQVMATWAESSRPIQSVRYSHDGQTLAILCGDWESVETAQVLYLVESTSLRTFATIPIPAGTAVVTTAPSGNWAVVHWSGEVTDWLTGLSIAQLPKQKVSAIAWCQDFAWWPSEGEQDQ